MQVWLGDMRIAQSPDGWDGTDVTARASNFVVRGTGLIGSCVSRRRFFTPRVLFARCGF